MFCVRCALSWADGGNITSSAWAAGRPRCQPSLAMLIMMTLMTMTVLSLMMMVNGVL